MIRTSLVVLGMVSFAAVTAQADTVARKGGEWRSVVTGIGPEPRTIDMCFAPATIDQAIAKMAALPNCSRHEIRVSGNVATITMTCDKMQMDGTVTFAGDSAYHTDLTMRMDSGPNSRPIHSLTDAKWIGACKPGETPR